MIFGIDMTQQEKFFVVFEVRGRSFINMKLTWIYQLAGAAVPTSLCHRGSSG